MRSLRPPGRHCRASMPLPVATLPLLRQHLCTRITYSAALYAQELHTRIPWRSRLLSTASEATTSVAVAPLTGQLGDTKRRVKQVVDYSTLVACVEELKGNWVPSKVEQVIMSDKTTLALKLKTLQGISWLTVSWHPVAGRLAISGPPDRGSSAEAFSLAEIVNSQLAGLVLVGVQVPQAWERVAQLQFGVRPGEPASRSLYCEVMARYSNVVLAQQDGEILACAYQVGSQMSSLRLLQVGRTYQLPPIITGIPPDACSTLQEWRDTVTKAAGLAALQQAGRATAASQKSSSNDASASTAAPAPAPEPDSAPAAAPAGRFADGCIRAFLGVSPYLVEEMCEAAGVQPSTPPSSLSDPQWACLHQQWLTWLQRVHSGQFAASSDTATGRFSVFGSFGTPHTSVMEMVESYYGQMQGTEVHAQLHQRLRSTLAAVVKKLKGKVGAFKMQMKESERAHAVQREADLITANLYRIPAGAAEVEVEDWDTGQPVVVKLDANKSAVQVAEGLYKKTRKLRRAVDAVAPLLEAAEAEVGYLEEVEVALSQLGSYREAEDLRALREVQDELVQQGYMKPPSDAHLAVKSAAKAAKSAKSQEKRSKGKGGGAGAGPAALGLRQFVSPNGFQVLVGRNNRQNDELSHSVAKPEDVWMHIRGRPGSHTVIRVPAGRTPDDADLQFAADLAAFFSKGRSDGKVDVMMAKAAALKKPKGAKPGQVLVTKELGNIVARPGSSIAAQQEGA